MKDLITIIVPIYNSEKYLHECLKSIEMQTYSNIEVLLIVDGATDKSLDICKKISNDDDRFKVINIKNHGVSFVRNLGIKHSKGNYISFVDSDDIIDRNYIKFMYDTLIKCNADLVCCGYTRNYDEFIDIRYNDNVQCISKDKYLKNIFYQKKQKYYCLAPWGKLYKNTVINKIKYPEGKIYEDVDTIIDIVSFTNKIVINKNVLYYYRNTENSITNKKFNKNRLIMNEVCEKLIKNENDEKLKKAILSFYYCRNVETLIMLIECKNDDDTLEYKEVIKKNLKINRMKVLLDLNTKLAVKISALVTIFNDKIILRVYKTWKG